MNRVANLSPETNTIWSNIEMADDGMMGTNSECADTADLKSIPNDYDTQFEFRLSK